MPDQWREHKLQLAAVSRRGSECTAGASVAAAAATTSAATGAAAGASAAAAAAATTASSPGRARQDIHGRYLRLHGSRQRTHVQRSSCSSWRYRLAGRLQGAV